MVINRHWTSSVRTWEMEAFEDHGTSAKHTPHLLAVLEGKMMINEWIPGYLILRRTHISVRDWGLDCPPKTSYGSSLHLRNWASLPFELPQCPRWKREGFFNHNVQVSAWFFAVSSARDRRMQRQWWAEAIAESNQLCLIREIDCQACSSGCWLVAGFLAQGWSGLLHIPPLFCGVGSDLGQDII